MVEPIAVRTTLLAPVAAEDVADHHGLVLAGEPVREVDADPPVTVLGDVGHLDVPAQAHRGLVFEVDAQQVLELRLVEHVRSWVPVPALVQISAEQRDGV
jgi:hypothetical protein